MDQLFSLLSINQILFSVFDYPVSIIEFIGTVLYISSVWLVAKQNIWTWPVGIVSVILFGFIFYQCQLYADMFEQSYYLLVSLYGWILWPQRNTRPNNNNAFRYSSAKGIIASLVIIGLGTTLLTLFIADLHNLYPLVFPQPADYPLLDSLTTMMSLVAMFLLTRKRVESWYYWIIVDVIAVGLYLSKGLLFLSGQYVILLVIACYGLYRWRQGTLAGKSAYI